MAKRIISDEQKRLNETKKLYESQKTKVFNYNINDFEICGGCWKHKNWNTWMKGVESYSETQKIVQDYINECNKPYGQRDLSKFHLYN